MDNTMLVQVLNSGNHLLHDFAGVFLRELLRLYNAVEELATCAVLHHYVNVAVVDEGLMELDNVWVINLSEDKELFFQEFDVFGDV